MTKQSSKYVSEEVLSSCAYPIGYKGARSVVEQAAILGQLFTELRGATFDLRLARNPFPQGAEDWFVIPPWQLFAPTYGEAVEVVFEKVMSQWQQQFRNNRTGQLGAKYLRQLPRTEMMFEEIRKEQCFPNLIVVPAQFGFLHRGRSANRARELFAADEFGLGVFAAGIMLLTHPERIYEWEELHIVCAGDEFSMTADGDFSGVPIFNFCRDKLNFIISWRFEFSQRTASVSAVRPQPLACESVQKA